MDSISNIVKRLRESRLSEARERYSKLDHDELIVMAQTGDQAAFEELLKQYNPIIQKQADKFFLDNGNGDRDDVTQVASLAFWDAVKSYDSSVHKHGFGAYASMIIKRKLTDLLRKEDADVRKLNNFAASMEDKYPGSGDDEGSTIGDHVKSKELSPEEKYLGNDGAREITNFIKNSLSDVERDVISMYIEGYKVSEIAEEKNMKYKSVENALMRVKNKLADYLRARESKKIRESTAVEFSDEEKSILKSVLSKINESEYKSYNEYDDESEYIEKTKKQLAVIEQKLEDIQSRMRNTHWKSREDLEVEVDELTEELEKISTDVAYVEGFEELSNICDRLENKIKEVLETDYEGILILN